MDGDCDDSDASVYPGADELCDGADNNCDGVTEELRTWYLDTDNDGYGSVSGSTLACQRPDGYAPTDDDCNDADSAVHPDAGEVCDLADNDCDLAVDGGLPDHTWRDVDRDGFGSVASMSCPIWTSALNL